MAAAAEDHSPSTPLLSSDQPQPHVILTVQDGPDLPQPEADPRPLFQSGDDNRRNPYAFIGAHDEFEVPGSSTIDPFRNHTPSVEGLYECLKILVCLPIALLRLALFGLSLTVGYLVTRLALCGWKDRQNPMPKWRCRLMWVTRFCGRAILFSFGYKALNFISSFLNSPRFILFPMLIYLQIELLTLSEDELLEEKEFSILIGEASQVMKSE